MSVCFKKVTMKKLAKAMAGVSQHLLDMLQENIIQRQS